MTRSALPALTATQLVFGLYFGFAYEVVSSLYSSPSRSRLGRCALCPLSYYQSSDPVLPLTCAYAARSVAVGQQAMPSIAYSSLY